MIWLASWYLEILYTHITCVVLSGSVFFVRGCLMLGGWPLANRRWVKWMSYVIDITLLAAAIALTMIIHQYPFVQAWLTAKVLLLVVYIVLGIMALRRGRTRAIRGGFFVASLGVFLFIISVAITRDPRGALLWLI